MYAVLFAYVVLFAAIGSVFYGFTADAIEQIRADRFARSPEGIARAEREWAVWMDDTPVLTVDRADWE